MKPKSAQKTIIFDCPTDKFDATYTQKSTHNKKEQNRRRSNRKIDSKFVKRK